MSNVTVDCDQHLYEGRSMWADHIDPDFRDDALTLVDDELGYTWLTWRGRPLLMVDVYLPGQVRAVGEHHQRYKKGIEAEYTYDEAIPPDYWDPTSRLRQLDRMGIDEAVIFPNYGLFWERLLSDSLQAVTANMGAWNRWCGQVVEDGAGRLHPVAQLTLRDPDWIASQLEQMYAKSIRLAMIAPALVNGWPLSHRDHDRIWAKFVECGVTPVLHVADQQRPFDIAWYTDEPDRTVAVLESVMLSTPPALAVSDLIINGTFEKHPDLRVGIFELGATWIPGYLTMLDEGWDFITRLNGKPLADLKMLPSDYFRSRVRVAAFSHEHPEQLIPQSGDLYMCCSDYPHAEGTDTPVPDYSALDRNEMGPLFEENIKFLLGADR
jgi:predicted TIM-barrel fold metal-dependent hydrolase